MNVVSSIRHLQYLLASIPSYPMYPGKINRFFFSKEKTLSKSHVWLYAKQLKLVLDFHKTSSFLIRWFRSIWGFEMDVSENGRCGTEISLLSRFSPCLPEHIISQAFPAAERGSQFPSTNPCSNCTSLASAQNDTIPGPKSYAPIKRQEPGAFDCSSLTPRSEWILIPHPCASMAR